MVKCIAGFLNVCYIVQHADITKASLNEFDSVLVWFHSYQSILQTASVHPTGFSLPCQHSLIHYWCLIEKFGAPNGLCSSITESRHITAIKKPGCWSNCYKALGQILLTNQQLDKLAAAKVDFWSCSMLPPSFAPPPQPILKPPDDDNEEGPVDSGIVAGNVTLACTRGMYHYV